MTFSLFFKPRVFTFSSPTVYELAYFEPFILHADFTAINNCQFPFAPPFKGTCQLPTYLLARFLFPAHL